MEKITFAQKKRQALKTVFTIVRDIATIFLAFAITDYVTEHIEISSSLFEFLVYFGILLIVTILGSTIQGIIKKFNNKTVYKQEDL